MDAGHPTANRYQSYWFGVPQGSEHPESGVEFVSQELELWLSDVLEGILRRGLPRKELDLVHSLHELLEGYGWREGASRWLGPEEVVCRLRHGVG